jgi:hypothetical protein
MILFLRLLMQNSQGLMQYKIISSTLEGGIAKKLLWKQKNRFI